MSIRAGLQSRAAARAPYGESDWVARIRESDRAAFEALVRHYSDPLCAFIYNNTRDVEATKELTQDLFLWIWRHRHEWDVRGGLTTYLYRSARNRAISYLRHDRLERRWQDEMLQQEDFGLERSYSGASDNRAGLSELSDAIDRGIRALPERCRQVFTLNRQH